MDAITMLKEDHQTVERLFKQFEQAGDRAYKQKRDIVDRIIEELSVHAAIEEQLFYPVTREVVPETNDDALESVEEHRIVAWLLHELRTLDPQDERFDALVTVTIENVRHHVSEEEGEYFPKVREALGRNAMNDLGDAMVAAREVAPTKPHPRAPRTPPGNLVVGTAAGVADRVGDTVSGVAQGGVTAARDLVARLTGRPKPRVAPTGAPTAKRTAEKVRAQLGDAVDDVRDAADDAHEVGEATTRRAVSSAKATATSARRNSRRTATTAKAGATKTKRTAKRAAAST